MIKIAMIGSEDFCQRAAGLLDPHSDISLNPYIYQHPKEARGIVATVTPCDAILFSGSLPYQFALDELEKLQIPSVYLKQDETAIAMTLLFLSTTRHIHPNAISIDIRDPIHMRHVLNDLSHSVEGPFIYPINPLESIDPITDFHAALYRDGKTVIGVTSIHAVYERLVEYQVPAMKMIDPESNILHTIEEAKQKALYSRSKSSQIAVGLIRPLSTGDSADDEVSQLANMLHGHAAGSENGHSVFTTLGNIEKIVGTASFQKLFQKLSTKAHLAFGAGESTVEASQHAEQALSLSNHPDQFYVLDGFKQLRGPLPQKTDSIIDMQLKNPAMLKIADRTKLSPSNISKIIQFGKFRHSKQFSANDLATYMNVTRRTAERIIKKMSECGYIRIAGEEMTYKQGRPRTLYELNFPLL
ncbi:HTH domain-containing protein [Sporosarcina sp. Te-1]|uniref:HTH domain-containing protein n=1 Tax=Sporosarcina sp. Te-1 TaxID=2818390 RepID=UPI001A9EFF54|nr:HTH domain-containing protein [Sporosarcina sp. Te-1]QTD41257.1 HTH domain-containing protein [Sporosarcina sp. Te-1]